MKRNNNMDSHTISHKSNGIITVLKRRERIPLNMAKIKNILLKAGITLTSLFSIIGIILVCVCYASEWFAEHWTMNDYSYHGWHPVHRCSIRAYNGALDSMSA